MKKLTKVLFINLLMLGLGKKEVRRINYQKQGKSKEHDAGGGKDGRAVGREKKM